MRNNAERMTRFLRQEVVRNKATQEAEMRTDRETEKIVSLWFHPSAGYPGRYRPQKEHADVSVANGASNSD